MTDLRCYRVWAKGSAVLVDAESYDDARWRALPLLACNEGDIESVQCLTCPGSADTLKGARQHG